MLTTSPTFALTAVKYSEGRGGRRNEWGRRDPKRGTRGKRERGKREGKGEGREEKWSFLSQQQAAVLNSHGYRIKYYWRRHYHSPSPW